MQFWLDIRIRFWSSILSFSSVSISISIFQFPLSVLFRSIVKSVHVIPFRFKLRFVKGRYEPVCWSNHFRRVYIAFWVSLVFCQTIRDGRPRECKGTLFSYFVVWFRGLLVYQSVQRLIKTINLILRIIVCVYVWMFDEKLSIVQLKLPSEWYLQPSALIYESPVFESYWVELVSAIILLQPPWAWRYTQCSIHLLH